MNLRKFSIISFIINVSSRGEEFFCIYDREDDGAINNYKFTEDFAWLGEYLQVVRNPILEKRLVYFLS